MLTKVKTKAMNKYSKQLFDLAWELSLTQAEGLPKPLDERVADLEKRVNRCEELIMMQVDINNTISDILKDK